MQFEMPRPGPAHEKLARMAGHWIGDETMMPSPWSPEQQPRRSEVRGRMLDGFFLISEYEQCAPDGTPTFRGHGVYSYDPQTDCYKMHWFDSMGGPGGIATGKFEGDTLTFRNTSPMGHHRYRYELADGRYTFEMAMSPDGDSWNVLMKGDYRPGD